MNKNVLLANCQTEILRLLPRFLTQLDQDPLSPTFGCFDRNFWHYRLRDFSSMVLQQNVVVLALLYTHNFAGNTLYQHSLTKDLIAGCLHFWQTQQHKNGTFDEYWPHEQGYPPLVFSTFAVLRTLQLVKLDPSPYLPALQRAIKQIILHTEKQALNQEWAGVACLGAYAALLPQQKNVSNIFQKRLSALLKQQTGEGWFSEYGGADIGYSSVTLHYLAFVAELTKDERVWQAGENLLNFLQYFVHPDGTAGGEYGSRNTEYFLLGGLAAFAMKSATARSMLARLNWSLDKYDDRYLFHYTFMSFVEGTRALQSTSLSLPEADFSTKKKYWPQAGLLIHQSSKHYLVINAKKGGVYKFFYEGRLVGKSGGYRFQQGPKLWTSNWWNEQTRIIQQENKLTLETNFSATKHVVSSPVKHILLRLATLLPAKRQLIHFLKKVIIFQTQPGSAVFKRTFRFTANEITIEDQALNLPKNLIVQESYTASSRFVPSSKFSQLENWQAQQLKYLTPNTKTQTVYHL